MGKGSCVGVRVVREGGSALCLHLTGPGRTLHDLPCPLHLFPGPGRMTWLPWWLARMPAACMSQPLH